MPEGTHLVVACPSSGRLHAGGNAFGGCVPFIGAASCRWARIWWLRALHRVGFVLEGTHLVVACPSSGRLRAGGNAFGGCVPFPPPSSALLPLPLPLPLHPFSPFISLLAPFVSFIRPTSCYKERI